MIRQKASIAVIILVTLLLCVMPVGIAAQGAPEPIQDALAALNERLGLSLTLNDLFWSWGQDTFDDSALGCPAEGETPTPETIIGYEFEFTWDGQIYKYRVSADRTITRFCGVRAEGEPETDASGELTEEALSRSNVLCGEPPEDQIFMRTRLTSGIRAQVLPGLPNNLRAQPDAAAEKIGEIPAQAAFDVIAGPTCTADGTLWWQVNYNGQSGYTAEGREGEYFVQPEPPTNIAASANRPEISAENLDIVSEVTRIYGSFSGGIAWGPDFKLLATGNAGSEGLWVYSLDTFTSAPTILESVDRLTEVKFSPADETNGLAVVGADDGTIRMWNVSLDGTLVERVVLNGHNDPVSAIGVSADGQMLASVGGLAFVALDDDAARQNAIVLWDVPTVAQLGALVGHQDAVTGLVFDPNGGRIVSASRDGSLRLWDASARSQTGIIEGEVPVTAVAWSPDGASIAAAYEDGTIALIDASTFTQLALLTGHGGVVNALAFSPDSGVLASGGADSRLILWGVASMTTDEPVQAIPTTSDNGDVRSIAFSPDGAYVAIVQANNVIRIWQPAETVG